MQSFRSIGSAPDPYILTLRSSSELRSGTGYTLIARAADGGWLTAGESTAVLLAIGQSTIGNWATDGAYAIVNANKNHIFNIADGGVYTAKPAFLGSDGGSQNFLARLADQLITAGTYTRVITCCIALGGTKASDWETGLGATYPRLNERITVACRRLVAAGLMPTKILWGQGETDAFDSNGVGGNTSQAAYTASVQAIVAYIRTFGFNANFLVAKQTHWTNSVGASGPGKTAIQAAQLALVNHGAGIWAGPDCDSLDDTNRQDGVHWNATGANAVANLWKAAIIAAT